jgi:hypothetical protein
LVSKHSRFGPLQGKGQLVLIEMKAISEFHQRRDEVDVTGQAIQFGDDEGGRIGGPWAIAGRLVAFAALHLYNLLHVRPAAAVKETDDWLLLRLEAQTADSVSRRRPPQIAYEFAVYLNSTFQDIRFNRRQGMSAAGTLYLLPSDNARISVRRKRQHGPFACAGSCSL